MRKNVIICTQRDEGGKGPRKGGHCGTRGLPQSPIGTNGGGGKKRKKKKGGQGGGGFPKNARTATKSLENEKKDKA